MQACVSKLSVRLGTFGSRLESRGHCGAQSAQRGPTYGLAATGTQQGLARFPHHAWPQAWIMELSISVVITWPLRVPHDPINAARSAFHRERSLMRWLAQSAAISVHGMPHTFSV